MTFITPTMTHDVSQLEHPGCQSERKSITLINGPLKLNDNNTKMTKKNKNSSLKTINSP